MGKDVTVEELQAAYHAVVLVSVLGGGFNSLKRRNSICEDMKVCQE